MASDGGGRVLRVGIGDFVVSNQKDDVITTIALGSCVAVCLWEPEARIAGMLHFMLPDSKLNAERAAEERRSGEAAEKPGSKRRTGKKKSK